jgi:hypothetical protein
MNARTNLSFLLLLLTILGLAKGQMAVSPELKIKLKTATTELERVNLLNSQDFIFDFSSFINATTNLTGLTVGRGGRTVSANPTNFPALIGHGIAMTVGFIEPCGINLPHTHPRATEINFIVSGEFRAGFFLENGAHFIGKETKKKKKKTRLN